MTPHSILEQMSKVETAPRFKDIISLKPWAIAKSMVAEAVHFDFGTAAPKREHIDFADGMLERGLFRLPFSVVLYTAQFMPQTGLLAEVLYDAQGRVDMLCWFIVAPVHDGLGVIYHLPLMVADLVDPLTGGGPKRFIDSKINWQSLLTGEYRSRKTSVDWKEEDYHAAIEKGLGMLLGGTALMMSKDVQTRVEPAPVKLNAKREKQGRPAIGPRHIITIRPELREHYARHGLTGEGGRASPRMHWRRGHFRRIGEDRVVPVAPSIINGTADALAAPKAYRMGGT